MDSEQNFRRDKGYQFIAIKQTTHQGDILILNSCMLNMCESSFIKQILLDAKSQINYSTVVVIGLNTQMN